MIFLDANIFLYALGADRSLGDPCASVLDRVGRGLLPANINSEVMQECLHVMLRKNRHGEAMRLASRLLEIFPEMLPVTREDMIRATDFLSQFPDLECRDAIHAATMLRNGIREIISFDPDFDRIPGIRRIVPS